MRLPDPGTWKYMLVHNFIRHGFPLHVSNCRSTARSFLSHFHGEAVPTICISDPFLRDRVLRMGGWTEVTPEVGVQIPKVWDEDKNCWKLDPENRLPWEYKPGVRTDPISEIDEVDAEDEIEIEGGTDGELRAKREAKGAAVPKPKEVKKPEPQTSKPITGPTPRPRA